MPTIARLKKRLSAAEGDGGVFAGWYREDVTQLVETLLAVDHYFRHVDGCFTADGGHACSKAAAQAKLDELVKQL